MKPLKSAASILLLTIIVLLAGIAPAYALSTTKTMILATPTNLSGNVQMENRRIVVTWTGPLSTDAYHQVEKTWPDGSITYHSPYTNGSFTDSGIRYNATYKYRVRTVKGEQKSAWSSSISRTLSYMPKPTDLKVSSNKVGDQVIVRLEWVKPVSFDWDIEVMRETYDGTAYGTPYKFTPTGSEAAADILVKPDTTYRYAIRGVYEEQNSAWTAWVTVTTPRILIIIDPGVTVIPTQPTSTPTQPTSAPTPSASNPTQSASASTQNPSSPTQTPTQTPQTSPGETGITGSSSSITPSETGIAASVSTQITPSITPQATTPSGSSVAEPAGAQSGGLSGWALALIGVAGTGALAVGVAAVLNGLKKKQPPHD